MDEKRENNSYVTLVLGNFGKEIVVDKVSLSVISPRFRYVFYTKHVKCDKITIPYVERGLFYKFLNSCYNKKFIPQHSIENTWTLYSLYRDYGLENLAKTAADYILLYVQTDIRSVWQIYLWAKDEEDAEIQARTRKMLIHHGKHLLRNFRVTNIDIDLLEFLYQQDDIRLPETVRLYVLNLYHDYFKHPMILNEEYIMKIRKMVRDIRFLTLTLEEFTVLMRYSDLITPFEKACILIHFYNPDTSIPYPEELSKTRIQRLF